MESPMTPSHLTLSDLERSNSKSLRFRSLVSRKGAELGQESTYGESIAVIKFDLSDLERLRSLRF